MILFYFTLKSHTFIIFLPLMSTKHHYRSIFTIFTFLYQMFLACMLDYHTTGRVISRTLLTFSLQCSPLQLRPFDVMYTSFCFLQMQGHHLCLDDRFRNCHRLYSLNLLFDGHGQEFWLRFAICGFTNCITNSNPYSKDFCLTGSIFLFKA